MSRARLPSRGLLAPLAAALLVLGAGGPAHAQIIFDPDGTGTVAGPRTILGLDWLPGSSVSINAVPLSPADSGVRTFTNLYQAKLGATTGDTSSIPGLNVSFEITIVARINELVNDVNVVSVDPDGPGPSGPVPIVGTALFQSALTQPGSFMEIYYDDLTDGIGVAADDLTGAGFTDGLLILSGDILPGNFGDSNFTSQFTQVGLLDQAGADNRGGQQTVFGSGGSLLSTSVTFAHTDFFSPGIALIRTDFNTSLVDPFRQVNPSINFFLGDPRVYTPTLGAVNGRDGPDFLFQADANQSIITPEPGTMVLAFTGLATVSLGSLRKLRRRTGKPAA